MLPEYETEYISSGGAAYFVESGAAMLLPHTQGEPLARDGRAFWYPVFSSRVIIAADRSQTDAAVSDWSDLPDTNDVVCLYSGAVSEAQKDEILAMSYGMSGDYSLDEALELLRYLNERERLVIAFASGAASPFELAPVCVMYEHEAEYLRERGADIEIVFPSSGTLCYDFGLVSAAPINIDAEKLSALLDKYGLEPSGEKPADSLADYNTARMTCGSRVRREVYGSHKLATADGNEHLASWLVLLVVVVLWGSSIIFRVVHRPIKLALTGIVSCLAFWALLRIFRFSLAVCDDPFSLLSVIARLCWYCYYIPLLVCPLLLLLAAWASGRSSENERPPGWWRCLAVASGVMFSLVITNDVHQLVFIFLPGLERWDQSHAYGAVGYVVYIFMAAVYAAFIVLLFKRQASMPGKARMAPSVFFSLLLPIFLILGALYRLGLFPVHPGDLTFTTCLLICFFARAVYTPAFFRQTPTTPGCSAAPVFGCRYAAVRAYVSTERGLHHARTIIHRSPSRSTPYRAARRFGAETCVP